jgi:serine/threonine protein kinase
LLRWARQAAEALQFLHENGICHGDVNCSNFFLDQHLKLKVGDFTSSLVGSLATPQDFQEDIKYGSALYEMATGYLPYHTLSEDIREQKLKQRKFLDLTTVGFKSLILQCWNAEYTTLADIVKDIELTNQLPIDASISEVGTGLWAFCQEIPPNGFRSRDQSSLLGQNPPRTLDSPQVTFCTTHIDSPPVGQQLLYLI